jgi:nitroreductase
MFLDLVRKRRSIRLFKDKEVEEEKINKLIQAVLMSPSSRNIKPWNFIIVKDREMLNKLSKSKEHGSLFLKNANLGVVVFSDNDQSDVCVEDASIASIYIQLAAESLGLGSCWIQIRKREHNSLQTADEYVSKLLNISDNFEVESIIAIGYPDEERRPYNIKDLDYSKVYQETYK